jgi:Matrixin
VRRLVLLAAALSLAVLAAGIALRAPTAQTTSPGTNGACRSDQAKIPAADLPATVDLKDCPISGSVITDHGVETALPPPGQGTYVEAMMTDGSEVLQVTRQQDGTVELEHVGDEKAEAQGAPEIGVAGSSPGECSDPAYTNLGYRVQFDLKWYFNSNTTPNELSKKSALSAIRRGTANITDMQSNCRRGDRVPHFMNYQGSTNHDACPGHNDSMSVVSFGTLPRGTLAETCTVYASDNPYNRVKWSDIKINKAHFNWTTNPGARSCKSRYDLEGVVTHERGHTFGLDHVSESSHRNLTMSERINGPCQDSERSLGLGDWRGLKNKYKNYKPS